jgi:hypothetical protein
MTQPEAVAADHEQFVGHTERFRRQLLAHSDTLLLHNDADDPAAIVALRQMVRPAGRS